MKLFSPIAAVLLCCALLTGCAEISFTVQEPYQPAPGHNFTYKIMNEGKAPQEALAIFRERIIDGLDAAGLTTQSDAGVSRIVEIVVTRYQMRPGWERSEIVGPGGSDRISTSISVKDAVSNAVLSRFEAETTYSLSWVSSRSLIRKHADKIIDYLKTGKP